MDMTFPWAIACWGHSACNGRRMPLFGLRVTRKTSWPWLRTAEDQPSITISHQPI